MHLVNPTMSVTHSVMRGLDPRICRWHEMAGSSPAMTKTSVRLWPSGMKEGWSVPSRGANFSLIGERGRSTPAIFRRSLSPHSLRDVSKPRGHSTQPLLLQHVQDCIQAPALSPHSKGDIRTAPPSRSRVTDYKHNNRNAVKKDFEIDGE